MFAKVDPTSDIWVWYGKNISRSAYLLNVASNVVVFNQSSVLSIPPPANFSEQTEFCWYQHFKENWTALVTLLCMCAALVLNVTLLTFGCRRRTVQSLWLILNLASSDLMVNLLHLPRIMFQIFDESPVPVICFMQYLAWGVFAGSSMGGILLISVMRWWAYVDVPITQAGRCSKILMFLSWAISLLMGFAIQITLLVPYLEYRVQLCSSSAIQHVLHKYANLFEITFLSMLLCLIFCNVTRWERIPGNRVHPIVSIISSQGHRCNADCVCSDPADSISMRGNSFGNLIDGLEPVFPDAGRRSVKEVQKGNPSREVQSYLFTATWNHSFSPERLTPPALHTENTPPGTFDNDATCPHPYTETEQKPMELLEVWSAKRTKSSQCTYSATASPEAHHQQALSNYSADTSELSHHSSPIAPKMPKPKLNDRLKQLSLKYGDHDLAAYDSPSHESPTLSQKRRRRLRKNNSNSIQGKSRCLSGLCQGFSLICKSHTQNCIIIFAFLAKCLPILILLLLCANGSPIKALPSEDLVFAWMTFVTMLNPLFYGFQHPSVRAQYRQTWRRSCLSHA